MMVLEYTPIIGAVRLFNLSCCCTLWSLVGNYAWVALHSFSPSSRTGRGGAGSVCVNGHLRLAAGVHGSQYSRGTFSIRWKEQCHNVILDSPNTTGHIAKLWSSIDWSLEHCTEHQMVIIEILAVVLLAQYAAPNHMSNANDVGPTSHMC